MESEYSRHLEHSMNRTFGKWKLNILRYLADQPMEQGKQGEVL